MNLAREKRKIPEGRNRLQETMSKEISKIYGQTNQLLTVQ